LNIKSVESWFTVETQLEVMERRAALLARRHIDDTSKGIDTSYSTFDLAMAHADLTYWRGIQGQILQVPEEHSDAFTALGLVASTHPYFHHPNI
jgi:hypothetical protein